MTDVTIIIVSYNVKQLLLNCLQSIYSNSNGLTLEVIVVDNNSKDKSPEVVKQAYTHVHLIENTENKGFSAANNQAIAMATGKYILLLNPDTEIVGGALQKCVQYLNSDLSLKVVAPKLLNTNGTLQHSFWRFPTLWNITVDMFYLQRFFKSKYYPERNFNETFEVDSLSGAALLFNKEVVAKIGMLDERLFWMEDVDFCYRAKLNGIPVVYFPGAEIVHHIGQSAKKDYRISLTNQVVSKIKFFKKHYSFLSTLLLIIISFFHCIAKLIAFAILSPFSVIARRKAQAYLYMLPKIFTTPDSVT